MIDVSFPHIVYEGDAPYEWGKQHGETYREAIHELANIRKELMLARSPHLKDMIPEMAKIQWQETKSATYTISLELTGIQEAANISIEDLVILNNYTDFRDIHLPEEGCSTVGFNRTEQVSGQTWDMHSSAKNYVCTIERPKEFIVFSLVGCPGMMGINNHGLFVGVNNINTRDASPGILWPAFVRQCLEESQKYSDFSKVIKKTKFTGAHNYLLSDGQTIEHWEISPTKSKLASRIKKGEKGIVFHTNHCIHQDMIEIEEPLAQNSTSQNRYDILEEKTPQLETSKDLFNLLQDHTGYPKSVCGHFQSGAQDPSTTCGGGVYNHNTGKFKLWRGCPTEDENYSERELSLK